MQLCKVTGTVVATRKLEVFRPAKLLVVHRVDAAGNVLDDAREMLALDPRFGAGIGDYVLVAREGAAVAQVMETSSVPANVVILGVVDDWSYEA
jgi:microcompartment protein CcmK/EutM